MNVYFYWNVRFKAGLYIAIGNFHFVISKVKVCTTSGLLLLWYNFQI